MGNDPWVTAALTDDTLVVELLLRLKQSSSSDSSHGAASPSPPSATALLPPIGWGHRQPRSKPTSSLPKKDRDSTRCSPTTPLSWSAASTSDDSSRPSDRSSDGRSKAAGFTSESPTTAANKKSRKRKTFAELKEEEGFLLNERIYLNKELASMRVTFNEQMARSQNLKRIKLDMHVQSGTKMGRANSYQYNHTEASAVDRAPSVLPRHAMHDNSTPLKTCKVEKDVEAEEKRFVLPDLNVMPCEEES